MEIKISWISVYTSDQILITLWDSIHFLTTIVDTMHILFDADGTFLSTNYLQADELWVDHAVLQEFFIEAFPPTVTGKADLKEILEPYLVRMWRGKSVEDFMKTWFESQTMIREWMNELLTNAKASWNICSLCTQQEKYRSQYMKDTMGFSTIFDACYITAEIWYSKKSTDFYKAIVSQAGIDSDKTVFVDDKKSYCDVAASIWITTYHFDGDVEKFGEWMVEKWLMTI